MPQGAPASAGTPLSAMTVSDDPSRTQDSARGRKGSSLCLNQTAINPVNARTRSTTPSTIRYQMKPVNLFEETNFSSQAIEK